MATKNETVAAAKAAVLEARAALKAVREAAKAEKLANREARAAAKAAKAGQVTAKREARVAKRAAKLEAARVRAEKAVARHAAMVLAYNKPQAVKRRNRKAGPVVDVTAKYRQSQAA